MRMRGPFFVALWGVLSLTHSVFAANEAFGSLMLFLYNAYRFDELATNGKPGLADKCKPQDSDGASSEVYDGCNFHGFLRHVLTSPYDPSDVGFDKVSNPWMPTEDEVADLQDWDGVKANGGYNAARVMGSSGNYFNSHLMFRVVAARVKKLADEKPDAASAVYGGMLNSVDRIQFAMRSDDAGKVIDKVEDILGDSNNKLVTTDVDGLYGLPGYKKVDLKATAGALGGDGLSMFRSSMKEVASDKLKNDKNLAFRDVVLLRDELSMGFEGGNDRCGGRNRDSNQRDKDDKKKEDEENCKLEKRSFFGVLADALFKRQNGKRRCVSKEEVKYETRGHHYHTPAVTCNLAKCGQACYHYRSVMSVQSGVDSMTAFTCNDGTSMSFEGQATSQWGSTAKGNGKPIKYAQHNFAWTSGLPKGCERDEWPPKYFWPEASTDVTGKSGQRVRFIPRSDNNSGGKIWPRFCTLTGPHGPMTKTKRKVVENTRLYKHVANPVTNKNLGNDKTMTESITYYVETPRAVFSLQYEDAKMTLPNDGLDDNPCLPDIVRGTDPGWALLTEDEYYDRNPHLQMYTTLYQLYESSAVPQSLPPQPVPSAGPAPPRRLRRGTRAGWENIVVVDEEGETCLNGGMERLEEMEEEYNEAVQNHGRCTELEDPASIARNPDVAPTDVPDDEGAEGHTPEAESRQSASPEFPIPTGA